MKEKVYKTQISDVRIEATLFKPAFHLKSSSSVNGIMAQISQTHQHSTYEIFIVIDGTLTVTDEQGSSAHSNSIIIIPPYFNHYTTCNVSDGYCMYFTLERDTRKSEGIYSSITDLLAGKISVFDVDGNVNFYIHRLAENIEGEHSDEDSLHLLSLLFSSLFRRIIPSPPSQKNSMTKYGKYIFTIDSFISSNYTKRIKLDDLAAELFLCPKQVARIIKKEYGCSLSDLVNRRRLTVACMLIKNTNLDMNDIASMVGYEYENYFFTLFKKEYGTSPSKFREDMNT